MDLKAILEYSPYDNKRVSPFGNQGDKAKGKSEFLNNFFVDYSKYTKDTLDVELCEVIKGVENTIIFYGASGSGKTTYLNYFVDTYADAFDFHMINLIEDAAPTDYERCIRNTILSKLCALLDNSANGVTKELYRIIAVEDTFIPFDREEDNNLFIDYLVETLQRWKKSERYMKKIGIASEEKDMLVNNINENLLALYVLAELINSDNKLIEEKKHVFVFDNLDEIPTQYICSSVCEIILSAYSAVQDYCGQNTEYNFLHNCTFLMSFRSTNAQIVDSTQHQERLFMSRRNIEFGNKHQVSYSKILNRRMDYYWSHEKDVSKKDSITKAVELLNTENDYCSKMLRPLFNYDYRMYTTLFVVHLLRKDFSNVDERIVKTNESVNRSDSAEQTGARGILLFNALQSMMLYNSSRFVNYVRHEFEDETLCNVYRMSFTLLSNLGGWSMINDLDLQNALKNENDFNDETPRISLYKFVKTIENWYGHELVNTAIEGLLGATAYNYEYPVVLVGGKVDAYYSNTNNSHTSSGLTNYIENLYNDNVNSLSNIYVKINPLCVLYSWRVFINFEYINLISTKWESTDIKKSRYIPVPLFQINTDYLLRTCLNSVFLTVEHVLNMADRHFCDKCLKSNKAGCKYKSGPKIQKRSDVESTASTCRASFYSFMEEGFCVRKSMYSTRLITSHINYLERYRRYMRVKLNDKRELSEEIQRTVIKHMYRYIKFWDERRVVTSPSLFEHYRKEVQNAINKMHEDPFIDVTTKKIDFDKDEIVH